MESNQLNSPNILHKRQCKDKHFEAQSKRVFKAFHSQPKTMLMVSIETGIYRANICRFVAEWKRQSRIGITEFGLCAVSKHRAGYYTTDLSYFKDNTNE